MSEQHRSPDLHPPFWKTRYAIGWLVLAAVAAWFLLTRHLAHVMGALPYLLFLACPLMHLFMHHGHGRHHHEHHTDRASTDAATDAPTDAGGQHGTR